MDIHPSSKSVMELIKCVFFVKFFHSCKPAERRKDSSVLHHRLINGLEFACATMDYGRYVNCVFDHLLSSPFGQEKDLENCFRKRHCTRCTWSG